MEKSEIKLKFREFIKSRNGTLYKDYKDSILESDLISFMYDVMSDSCKLSCKKNGAFIRIKYEIYFHKGEYKGKTTKTNLAKDDIKILKP